MCSISKKRLGPRVVSVVHRRVEQAHSRVTPWPLSSTIARGAPGLTTNIMSSEEPPPLRLFVLQAVCCVARLCLSDWVRGFLQFL